MIITEIYFCFAIDYYSHNLIKPTVKYRNRTNTSRTRYAGSGAYRLLVKLVVKNTCYWVK